MLYNNSISMWEYDYGPGTIHISHSDIKKYFRTADENRNYKIDKILQ